MYKSQYHSKPVEAAFNECCSWENLFTGQDLWIPCIMDNTMSMSPFAESQGPHLRSQCIASLRLCEKWSLKMSRVVTPVRRNATTQRRQRTAISPHPNLRVSRFHEICQVAHTMMLEQQADFFLILVVTLVRWIRFIGRAFTFHVGQSVLGSDVRPYVRFKSLWTSC